MKTLRPAAIAAIAILVFARDGYCYIGPGAGFAFVGSFFVMFMAIFVAAAALLMWPVRILVYFLRRKKGYTRTGVGRVVVVGLDGMDPRLARRLMDEGRLPNFKAVADAGSFMPLQTTCPAMSPVAWSSFATGLTPARHGIFDFLDRDLMTYQPVLSSASIGRPKRHMTLGRYRIPLGRPAVKLRRKGTPFWSFLGEKGVSCSIIRVPITFPPEKFEGRLLSAMCAPDLLGTQGTFSFYTERPPGDIRREGGQVFEIKPDGSGSFTTTITGPRNTFVKGEPPTGVPLTVKVDRAGREAAFRLPDGQFTLKAGEYSGWKSLSFKMAPGVKARGICRFLVTSMDPFEFYVTPINIDPESPALPISHPRPYAVYLGKLLGGFATLGLAEDTWALNEGVIDDAQFLDQCYMIHAEREAMLMNELDNVRKGLVVCVFDITDRVQHMFWRYTEPGHPALRDRPSDKFDGAITDCYIKMDEMLGRVRGRLNEEDVLIIMSDHGFGSFRRGVNLNSWLYWKGYLSLKDGAGPSTDEWFKNVDWKKTKAYALGLGGICINIKGRESGGSVPPLAVAGLKREIKEKLAGLMDGEKGARAIRNVYDMKEVYLGPYLDNGPELVVGFEDGYRVSWGCAKGVVDAEVFSDNPKGWSGDHCADFSLVPGVLFSNRKLSGGNPRIIDIGPTVIAAFGLDVPPKMEGRALL